MSIVAPRDSPYVFNSPEDAGVTFRYIKENYLPFTPKDIVCADAVPLLAEPGYSPVYRNRSVGKIKKALMPGLETYSALWKNAVANFADEPALALRPYDYATRTLAPEYVSMTFAEADAKQREFGAGVLQLLRNNQFKIPGCEAHAKIDDHVAQAANRDNHNLLFVLTLYLANREEWVIADLACVNYSITNTVLYDTLGPNASHHILKLTELPIVVTSLDHVRSVLALKREQPEDLATLIAVVSMDPLDAYGADDGRALVEEARKLNVELYDFNQVIGVGRVFPHPDLPPSPETVYTISFTSGTTGAAPKGVVLSHEVAAAGITFIICQAPKTKNDTALSFLPLAHIFERQSIAFLLSCGGMAGFPQMNGTPLHLVEDLKLLKPKHMANVPRVYTKFEAAIKNATLNLDLALKRALFGKIVATKGERQAVADGADGSHWLYDRVFLPAVRKLLGFDNMGWLITGLAPVSPLTVKFFKAALAVGMCQGYGLTELFAGFAISQPWEQVPGLCGPPGVCSEVRVRALPELGYTLDDPKGVSGELEIRGYQIFSHYYKNKEETAKVLNDGWFATGDVARIDPVHGRLTIVDRVKNFFKLAHGEYVTPEKVENVYLSSNSLLTQCFVHGDSLRSHLVAVVGVDPERVVAFLESCGVSRDELVSPEKILEHANKPHHRTSLVKLLNSNIKGLNGFELIQNLSVEFEPLRLDREVITPTIKIRRPIAAKFFALQIEDMYSEGPLIVRAKI